MAKKVYKRYSEAFRIQVVVVDITYIETEQGFLLTPVPCFQQCVSLN